MLTDYRTKISKLGNKLKLYDAAKLVSYLEGKGVQSADEINIVEFGNNQIANLKEAKRNASAANMQTVVNGPTDFFKSDMVPATEIRASMLLSYEQYLRTERKITRPDQFKNPYTRPVKDLTVLGKGDVN